MQARIRGLLARKRVRIMHMQLGRSGGMGMGNFANMMSSNGDLVQDYNNEKVLVSYLFHFS